MVAMLTEKRRRYDISFIMAHIGIRDYIGGRTYHMSKGISGSRQRMVTNNNSFPL